MPESLSWRRAARGQQQVAYSGTLQFASGSYVFQEQTTSLAIISGLDFTTPRLRLWANFPVIFQSTPWVSFTGSGMIPSGGTQSGMMGRQAGSKTWLFADAAYWILGDLPDLELANAVAYSGALRLPLTADARLAGLVSFSGFTGIVEGLPAPRQLGIGINYASASRRSVGAMTSLGSAMRPRTSYSP